MYSLKVGDTVVLTSPYTIELLSGEKIRKGTRCEVARVTNSYLTLLTPKKGRITVSQDMVEEVT